MKLKELEKLGFKPVSGGDWHELRFRHHLFITNDTNFLPGEDKWHIGYNNEKEMMDTFWFNQNLISALAFKKIFHVLTGFYIDRLPKS